VEFADELDAILNHRSGLFGISGISGDVREIEAAAPGNARAALALELFAHRAATTIAGMSASLDRIDALVFTGGIGEHAAPMRARICERLGTLGVSLDARANAAADESDRRVERSGPAILVITTREEWFAARECARVTARS
jgi:acetate kinase